MHISLIDHIVLVVQSVETTTQFYTRFLGEPEFVDDEQVCWKIGETRLFFGLPYSTYAPHDKDLYGLNHLAFRAGSVEELGEVVQHLDDASIAHSGMQKDTYSNKEFVWLDDPDGYRIEFYVRQ